MLSETIVRIKQIKVLSTGLVFSIFLSASTKKLKLIQNIPWGKKCKI